MLPVLQTRGHWTWANQTGRTGGVRPRARRLRAVAPIGACADGLMTHGVPARGPIEYLRIDCGGSLPPKKTTRATSNSVPGYFTPTCPGPSLTG